MEKFIKGDVVVIPFPFSDLSGSKRRPALVLSDIEGDDILLCQITSKQTKDQLAIPLSNSDFQSGGLPVSGFIRPMRIFTADKAIIQKKAGQLKQNPFKNAIKVIINELNRSI